MKNRKFSIKTRVKSFKYALNGLRILIRDEHNSRIHLFAAVGAIILAVVLDISNTEWLAIVIVVAMVFSLEIINSAIESLADFVSPHYNKIIKKVKDLSAAAVFVSALTSIVVAVIIFVPKILKLW
ncbi:MAG: diacylglycerol kinase [Bacteroidetes bacterium 4572_117]|nr:MAG: diacylglycerol kinase [Bacteroidetes bacterium 4572_117]